MSCVRAHRLVLAATLGVASTTTEVARADSAADTAAAQTLFDEAKALMQAKNFAAACPKLEQSQALQAAGGTLLFLALCREGEGKTATAWVTFNEVLSTARRDHRADREGVATEHLATLTPKLVKLTLDVPDAARVPGLELRRDGVVVPSGVWGEAVPVDPGRHALRATAPGRLPWELTVETTTPGATTLQAVPVLTVDPNAVLAPPPVAHATDPTPLAAPPTDEDRGRTQRIAGILVGATGVAGLFVGGAFGVAALVEKGNESGEALSSKVGTSATAFHEGNVSTVALSAGGALVLGGAALWFFAPQGRTKAAWVPAPLLGPGVAGLRVGRAW